MVSRAAYYLMLKLVVSQEYPALPCFFNRNGNEVRIMKVMPERGLLMVRFTIGDNALGKSYSTESDHS